MYNDDLIKEISYIKGLTDGLKLSEKNDEGKIISHLIDVIEKMADEIAVLDEDLTDLTDMVDEIDDAVCVLADEVDDDFDMYDDDLDDYDNLDDDDYEDDDSELFELECPNCGEDVMIDFDMLDGDSSIVCPNCHKEIELEFDYDCDCGCDDDCDCGCHGED